MSAIGNVYELSTTLPLMQRFEVDLPVAAMTEEAWSVIEQKAREKAYAVALIALLAAFAGATAARLIVPARRSR